MTGHAGGSIIWSQTHVKKQLEWQHRVIRSLIDPWFWILKCFITVHGNWDTSDWLLVLGHPANHHIWILVTHHIWIFGIVILLWEYWFFSSEYPSFFFLSFTFRVYIRANHPCLTQRVDFRHTINTSWGAQFEPKATKFPGYRILSQCFLHQIRYKRSFDSQNWHPRNLAGL